MKFHYAWLDTCAEASGTLIVLDVLRAFSTAAYAFGAGALSVSLVGTVDEALSLRQEHPGWLVLGEVGGLPPQGFDFGNSPTQIREQALSGRQLIQRTGAGTQAVVRSARAEHLFAASFVVARATLRAVQRLAPQQITFVLSGGEKNEEDLACAQYLQALFQDARPDPAPFIRRVYACEDARVHLDPLRPEFPESDLDYCTRIDAFDFAMPVVREDGRLVMRPARA